jgi:hypothetical protein
LRASRRPAIKSALVQKLWEENKRFLLVAGSALVLFLSARSCAIWPYAARAVGEGGTIARNQQQENQARRLYKEVRQGYHLQKALLEKHRELEKDLLSRFVLEPSAELKAPKGGEAKEVFFTRQIDRIWGEVHPKARQINCELPDKLSIRDLGLQPNASPEDVLSHARDLEILSRALNALVDAGVRKIERPRILKPEVLAVRDNPDRSLVVQRIELRARGSYESILDVLRRCQKPGHGVQAALLDLDSRRAGSPDLLMAHFEFGGFFFETVEEGR